MGVTLIDVWGGVGHSRGQESLRDTDGCRGQGEGRFCGINDLEVQDVSVEFTKHTCNSTRHQWGIKICKDNIEDHLLITGNSHCISISCGISKICGGQLHWILKILQDNGDVIYMINE